MKAWHFLLFWLGLFATPFASAYKQTVHVMLTDVAANKSVLQSSELWSSWGVSRTTRYTYQRTQNDLHKDLGEYANYLELLKYGADAEDTGEAFQWPISRAFSHFYNPQVNGKLDLTPLYSENHTSPDWSLEYSQFGSAMNIPAQKFSYQDAQRYFYLAFTAVYPEDRSLNMGKMFQALGHVVHHVQDMSQPEHTRLDMHCDADGCRAGYVVTQDDDTSLYEEFTEELLKKCNAYTAVPSTADAECSGLASYKNSYKVKKIYLGGYEPPMFSFIRDFWTNDAWAGLADFSSGNFISTDTAYRLDPNVAGSDLTAKLLPASNDLRWPNRANSYVVRSTANVLFPGITNRDLSKVNIEFIGVNATDAYSNQSVNISRMATFSIFKERVGLPRNHSRGLPPRAIFSVNHVNLYQRAEILMPMAVGYSAGVINHFFKKRIRATQDGDGVLITNISNVPISGRISIHYDGAEGKRFGSQLGPNKINLGVGQSQKIKFYSKENISHIAAANTNTLYAVLYSDLGLARDETIAEAVDQFSYVPHIPNCNAKQVAGNDTPDTRVIDLGKSSGQTTLTYDTYTVADRIVVKYEGVVKFDSFCVGTNGPWVKTINYSGESSEMTVEVKPNCFGTTGTGWNFSLSCPE